MHADTPGVLPLGATPSVTFLVEAGSAPSVLARIFEAFARRDIAIDGLTYNRVGDQARLQALALEMTEGEVRQVAGQIRRVVGVTHLEVRVAARQGERMRLCA